MWSKNVSVSWFEECSRRFRLRCTQTQVFFQWHKLRVVRDVHFGNYLVGRVILCVLILDLR